MGYRVDCGGSADAGCCSAGEPLAYLWKGIWSQAHHRDNRQRDSSRCWNRCFSFAQTEVSRQLELFARKTRESGPLKAEAACHVAASSYSYCQPGWSGSMFTCFSVSTKK